MAEKSMNRFNYHETDDGDGEGGGRVMKVCRSKGAEQHPDHVDRIMEIVAAVIHLPSW